MPARRPRSSRTSPTVALACLAASLLAVDAAFVLWPDRGGEARVLAPPPAREQVVLEMVEVTEQPPPPVDLPSAPPPIDATFPPEEVPDERVVEDVLPDLPLRLPPTPAPTSATARPGPPAPPGPPPPTPPAPPPPSTRIVDSPDQSPRLVRASLPVYPSAAQREGVRARAQVRVLISEGGQVLDAEIIERVLLDGRGAETTVVTLPFGLEAAALDAARRHQFRPARDDGDRVRAYAVLSLSFDPPR